MAVKVINGWACGYCGIIYNDQAKADVCRESHDIIYVPFTAKTLNSLLHFIHTKDDQYITKELLDTVNKYLRGN